MDDIAIWSRSLDEHSENVTKLLQSLLDNELYLNPKEMKLFCSEICFLGHQISAKVLRQMKVKWIKSRTGQHRPVQSMCMPS